MRLIDGDALYAEHTRLAYKGDYAFHITARAWLEKAPTVDAVPVVRCKDCRWWKTNYTWNGKEVKVCVVEPYEPVRKGDDYCSRGEREGGDE